MGLTIQSGIGKPVQAGVTDENRLMVAAKITTQEHEINHHYGLVFSVGNQVTPTGAGDCFLYIKNNNDIDMIISEVMVNAASDESITLKFGDSGIPIGGNEVTPVNRNAGSGNLADATVLSGVDITGLSGGSNIMGVFVKGGESSMYIRPVSSFILPKNKVLTAYVATGGIAIKIGLGISFHKAGE